MTSRQSNAYVLSALLHGAVAALVLFLGYTFSQNAPETAKVFELVAGVGDNYAAHRSAGPGDSGRNQSRDSNPADTGGRAGADRGRAAAGPNPGCRAPTARRLASPPPETRRGSEFCQTRAARRQPQGGPFGGGLQEATRGGQKEAGILRTVFEGTKHQGRRGPRLRLRPRRPRSMPRGSRKGWSGARPPTRKGARAARR